MLVGNESAFMAQDVFDVLGADVAGLHHLGDRTRGGGGPEQLDEHPRGWIGRPRIFMVLSTARETDQSLSLTFTTLTWHTFIAAPAGLATCWN